MLEDYLWPELDELDINDMWFQQDGTTSHTARFTIDLFKGKFGERVISRNGNILRQFGHGLHLHHDGGDIVDVAS